MSVVKDWRDRAACLYEDPDLFFPVGTTVPGADSRSHHLPCCQATPHPPKPRLPRARPHPRDPDNTTALRLSRSHPGVIRKPGCDSRDLIPSDRPAARRPHSLLPDSPMTWVPLSLTTRHPGRPIGQGQALTPGQNHGPPGSFSASVRKIPLSLEKGRRPKNCPLSEGPNLRSGYLHGRIIGNRTRMRLGLGCLDGDPRPASGAGLGQTPGRPRRNGAGHRARLEPGPYPLGLDPGWVLTVAGIPFEGALLVPCSRCRAHRENVEAPPSPVARRRRDAAVERRRLDAQH